MCNKVNTQEIINTEHMKKRKRKKAWKDKKQAELCQYLEILPPVSAKYIV